MEPVEKNKSRTKQPVGEQQHEGQSSADFLGQKDFFSTIAKIAGFLMGRQVSSRCSAIPLFSASSAAYSFPA